MKYTTIIAEAGVNHNGSVSTALELVKTAKAAGADIVKFQSFVASKLVNKSASMAEYQKENTATDESQFQMLSALELSAADHQSIVEQCLLSGIEFMSTPFDEDSLSDLVVTSKVGRLKISSGDITNGPLLLAASRTGLPIILSTGMSTLGEIEDALAVVAYGYSGNPNSPDRASLRQSYSSTDGQSLLRQRVAVLHCTTEYPAPVEEVNLRSMLTIKEAFGLTTGYSDHTEGIEVSIAAAAMGAEIIEKHFTLDRNMKGPDHRASLEPAQLELLVRSIRRVDLALGSGTKTVTHSEQKNLPIARKSLVAGADIHAGSIFSPENLAVLRPGTGASPMGYWSTLGTRATRDYSSGDVIVDIV